MVSAAGRITAILVAVLAAPSARACDCSSKRYPDYEGVLHGIDRIAEYEVVRIRALAGGWIATARVTRDWKSDGRGQRITILAGDNSCSSEPELGRYRFGKAQLLGPLSMGHYIHATCTPQIPEDILLSHKARRELIAMRAKASPNDIDAQAALVGDHNYWSEHRTALTLLDRLDQRFPNNAVLAYERAVAQRNLGDIQIAQKIVYRISDDPAVSGRATLLIEQLRADAPRKLAGLQQDGLRTPVYRAVDVAGQNLKRITLRNIDFRKIDARTSNWAEARVHKVSMNNARLTGANLEEARFYDVDLNGADLSGASAAGAHFYGRLAGADLRNLSARGAAFDGAVLTRADLSNADLATAQMYSANLQESRLDGARFDGANLRKVKLAGASTLGASFVGAALIQADLRGADLSQAVLTDANLDGALVDCATRFPEAFDRSSVVLVPMAHCAGDDPVDFRRHVLKPGESHLDRPDFTSANLVRANFSGLTLRESFRNATLDYANVAGVNFRRFMWFEQTSARNANMKDISGDIGIVDSDFTGAHLSASGVGQLKVRLASARSRLDGAIFENVSIKVTSSAVRPPQASTSTEGTRIENASIDCDGKPRDPYGFSGTEREKRRRAYIDGFVAGLEFARRLAGLGPNNRIERACAEAITTFLGDGCKTGRSTLRYEYACPLARNGRD